jgi:hypothetical protein
MVGLIAGAVENIVRKDVYQRYSRARRRQRQVTGPQRIYAIGLDAMALGAVDIVVRRRYPSAAIASRTTARLVIAKSVVRGRLHLMFAGRGDLGSARLPGTPRDQNLHGVPGL